MDSSCLLCLEVNKELLGSIEANSKQWREFDITQILEKHFWSMNTLHLNSWMCLSCWQVLSEFHKFYQRVQEAHLTFGKIKENEDFKFLPPKEEDTSMTNENLNYVCLEPEILIDQKSIEGLADISEFPIEKKYNSEESNILYKDPLEKENTVKTKNRGNLEAVSTTESELSEQYEDIKVKLEPADSTDNNDSDSASDDEDFDKNSSESGKTKKCSRRKEYDKFIAEQLKQINCDLCGTPFEDFSAMYKHFSQIHNQRCYLVCCNRKFYQRNILADHLKCHLNPDYFKCTQCDKILSDRKNLKCHMLRIHQSDDIVKKHTCDVCGKSFIQSYLLRTHKLIHLPKEEKKFPCNECGKLYGSAYSLKMHTEVVHLKKHSKVCYICGKSLGTSTEYKAHMRKHEGISPPIINCDVCGLRLISERSLKLHKESQHPIGGKKEHPCPVCQRISPTARALKKHIVTMHERGCDYKCCVCEKAFRRAETLKEHMASQHTGTTLYTCPWCPKTFNSNGNMHAHRKNVHPKENLELRLQKYAKNIT